MESLEQAFGKVETAADSAAKSAADLSRLVKQLQKAAREGNIAAIKRLTGRMEGALTAAQQGVEAAGRSWPCGEEEEEQYFRDDYAVELRRAAGESGLEIHERDGQLFAHPFIVRIMPVERAVRIDRKKVSAVRPSHLVGLLLKNQKKPPRHSSARFLESLYAVYSDIVSEESPDRMMKSDQGRVVRLSRIYNLFTSLPGSNREYDLTDFARDLYMLDANGPRETRKGAEVSFPASTGARRSTNLISFVGKDGQVIEYYGVRFTGTG